MFLKYLGKTENFKIGDLDFTDGPAEVTEEVGLKLISENPRSFVEVVKVPEAPEAPKAPKESKEPKK